MNAKIALAEYRNGVSIKELAARHGLTQKTVYNRLTSANGGHPLKGATGRSKLGVCGSLPLLKQTVASNMSKDYRTLSQILGLSYSTVQRIASRAS
jgi:transcriptional antiterminator